VDLKPFIDEIQVEVARLTQSRPKMVAEWEVELERLQALVRDQSGRLAKQLGLGGDPTVIFMLTAGVISILWAAFAIKRSSLDPNKPFEENIQMTELYSQIANTVARVVEAAGAYAEIYRK